MNAGSVSVAAPSPAMITVALPRLTKVPAEPPSVFPATIFEVSPTNVTVIAAFVNDVPPKVPVAVVVIV